MAATVNARIAQPSRPRPQPRTGLVGIGDARTVRRLRRPAALPGLGDVVYDRRPGRMPVISLDTALAVAPGWAPGRSAGRLLVPPRYFCRM